ncbi:DUF1294 domain-containing protein [Planctomycetales bacterium ZRK34]|nr:DUF1294 domain-containing protein [Planctomycetales bacterium ZRK34]
MIGVMIYGGAVLVLSFFGMIMIVYDKRQARLDRWRTPEATLHMIELLGGFPGVMLARRLFKHKTRKLSYRIIAALMAIVHVAVAGAVFYFIDAG